jgi:hypothetical protein
MFSFEFRGFIFFFNDGDDYTRAYNIMEDISDDGCLNLFDCLADIPNLKFKAIEVQPTELDNDEY